MPAMHLFTIPFGVPFAHALAEGAIARAGSDPLALADSLVLVPTRRAARTLRDAFAEVLGGAALGPQIRALGDVGEDDIIFDAASDDLTLPPAIAPLRRRLMLATLVQHWAARSGTPLPMAQAVSHAGELMRLLDEVTTQGADLKTLTSLAPEALAEHWNQVVGFLDIIGREWPGVLEEEGAIEPAQRRDMLLRGLAACLAADPPRTPVIAAGSTGSIPATAELLKVVASLPSGAVVLPGLDTTMDEASWDALDAAHAQYGLRELLARMGAERADVALWPESEPTRIARVKFLSEALRPPPTTDAWRDLLVHDGDRLAPAFGGFALIEAATAREEALTIAVALREELETLGRTAALVTPDRGLARRVAAELSRWDIVIDDSAGTPLSRTPAGAFLALLAHAAAEQFTPVPLLALLKHPLAAGGRSPASFRRRARQLEEIALRGLRPELGLSGIETRLRERLKQQKKDWPDLIEWFVDLAKRLAPLAEWMAKTDVALAELANAHAAVAEALAEDGAKFWHGEDGEAAAALIHELIAQSGGIALAEGREYSELFRDLAEMRPVRPIYGRHPRLAILGTQEARLQHFDLVALGGLNEGTWPADAVNDPFLSRPMRTALGLEAPERRIGLAAHDFAALAAAPSVLMTRSSKQDGAPTVPSRWVQRIRQLATGLGKDDALTQSPHLKRARALDGGPVISRIRRPDPRPKAQLQKLSVTEIETWLRDPYAIYAKHILKLTPLDPLEQEPGPSERGVAVHKALEAFLTAHPGVLPADAVELLIRCGDEAFRNAGATSEALALWRPRFARVARWFVDYERDRRAKIERSFAEIQGTLEIPRANGVFTLTGRADRIDLHADGTASVIDYKTGAAPTSKQIKELLSPQLPLEAAMLINGAFAAHHPDATARTMNELIHIQIRGSEPAGKELIADLDPDAVAAAALAALKDRVRQFDGGRPFLSRVRVFSVADIGDYDGLARVREWAIVEDDPMAPP